MDGCRFRPAGKPIDNSEEVIVLFAWWLRSDDIDVNLFDSVVGRDKLGKGSCSVPVYFCTLPRKTFSSPLSAVYVHAQPYLMLHNEFLRSSNFRMSERMEGVQNLAV